MIRESSQKSIKTKALKENNNYLNIDNVHVDPFQDFLNNYNKKFIDENSEITQSITDSQPQIDSYSKIEDQNEIIENNEEEDEEEKINLSNYF